MSDFLQVAQTYGWYGVLAFVVTAFATPLAAGVARRLGVMDMPDTYLKPHARPTPYLGGAAICLGWAAAMILALFTLEGINVRSMLAVTLGGVAMSALGLIDDVREVSPKTRLAAGAVIIGAVMLATGAGLELAETFLRPFELQAPAAVAGPVSLALGLFIVLGACNSTNLIDGLDGLCAGVTAIISLGFFAIAMHLAVYELAREENPTRLILAIAMFGATLGFLPLNFNPAKIFMGDAGSVLLGYNCGMMLLLFDERYHTFRWMFGGLMVFALPIFDTALAIVRRWRSGRSIFQGDRSHFYDQLVDRGMSVRRVVLISYGLSVLFAALGCLTVIRELRFRYILILYAAVVACVSAVIVLTGMARPERMKNEE
jgi:UDP-GlcNAc:undecaprenyl-phosphate GlcNAc-1-phosphate transferase